MARATAETLQAKRVRQPRPADLHRVIAEIHELWINKSGMDISFIANEIGVSAGNLYSWFAGKGAPPLLAMDAFLLAFGYHFEIVEGPGEAARRRREEAREDDSRRRLPEHRRNRDLGPDVHPLMVELYNILEDLDVNRGRICAEVGVGRGTLTNWFKPGARPSLIAIDSILERVGYRLKIVRGMRSRLAVDARP